MWKSLQGLMVLCALAASAPPPACAADRTGGHRVVFQVDGADPQIMTLTLNNVTNVVDYFRAKGEEAEIEIVAFGPGLNMYRADKSGVADRIRRLADYGFPSTIRFSACANTKAAMEKSEGRPIQLLPEATMVPSGVARIIERQEEGWSYVRP
jgi:hypothetical protein